MLRSREGSLVDRSFGGCFAASAESPVSELAYLVIREGSKWTDVFRLVPGQSVTIGRAPTNQIVVQDERCSRTHAELFVSNGQWTLRDLDSRNGTAIDEQAVSEDFPLSPGNVIRIGHTQLIFVHNLSQAFSDPSLAAPKSIEVKQTGATDLDDDSNVLEPYEPTTITHRRGQTRFLEAAAEKDEGTISRMGRAAARL